MAAFGILAALRHRDATGEGELVDVSMADGALSRLAMDAVRSLLGEPVRSGRRSPGGTTAAWSPCWSSRRRSTRSSCVPVRW